LDKMLTEAHKANAWLREGSSVPQQQLIRDFRQVPSQGSQGHQGTAADPAAGWDAPLEEQARSPAEPELHPARFRLKDEHLHLSGGIALTVVWSRDLPADPSSVRVHQDSA
jgi:putative transposase